jgi:hypothetical protein
MISACSLTEEDFRPGQVRIRSPAGRSGICQHGGCSDQERAERVVSSDTRHPGPQQPRATPEAPAMDIELVTEDACLLTGSNQEEEAC